MKRSGVRPSVPLLDRSNGEFAAEHQASDILIDSGGHPAATVPQHGTQ